MISKDKIFKILILIISLTVLAFNLQLYNLFEQQKAMLVSFKDKQDVESEFNSNKFKYQSDQIERVNKNLEDAKEAIKDQEDDLAQQKDEIAAQKDALLQEIEKRQVIESQSKNIQTSLVDIKAESDAIKQEMKGWQKDYVSVLADFEKKMDASQDETKNIEDNLVSLNIPELKENIQSLKNDVERISQKSAEAASSPPVPEKKVEEIDYHSQ